MSEQSIEARLERMENKIDDQGKTLTEVQVALGALQAERKFVKGFFSAVWGLIGILVGSVASAFWGR